MTKNHTTFRKAYNKEKRIYKKKRHAFWSALDEVCEGNIIYDFYWWFIWRGLLQPLTQLPRKIRSRHRFKRQRIRDGFADEDIWGWDEMILEFFDKGFTKYIEQTWGKDVETWNEKEWAGFDGGNRDKKLYDKIIDFQKNMEGLRYVRSEMDNLHLPKDHKLGDPVPEEWWRKHFELTNEETLAIESAWKNLNQILSEYHWSLWT